VSSEDKSLIYFVLYLFALLIIASTLDLLDIVHIVPRFTEENEKEMAIIDKPVKIRISYHPQQHIPINGLCAVYAIDAPGEDKQGRGKYTLKKVPLVMIAITKIVTEHYLFGHHTKAEEETDIIGYVLDQGVIVSCHEKENFAGYCKEDGDPKEAT